MLSIKEQYSKIAKGFSKTRYKKWDCVNEFLSFIKHTDKILELGCGNGKNIEGIQQAIGIDICPELCQICRDKGINVIEGDILDINFKESFNYILCIAVIHHFQMVEDRIKLLKIIYDLLEDGGKAIITCWTTEEKSHNFKHGDNYVKFGSIDRYYYIFDPLELYNMCKNIFKNIEYKTEFYNDIVIVTK
jgi:SAM-dependent methyltransferase